MRFSLLSSNQCGELRSFWRVGLTIYFRIQTVTMHPIFKSVPAVPLVRTNVITACEAISATREKEVRWYNKNSVFYVIFSIPGAKKVAPATVQLANRSKGTMFMRKN